ncbi:ABC transporter substrate-binding protein [Aestuariispira insulae]|uniref:ABC-type amino acid transport substrate-binding protein n=1 Tax=Aestuariispira insulae TaxID=1461337 RepID=A0A3D9H6I2_9PROT|nr:ABC transporter substrate-binding protein [Aestuariispira insulae]RED45127.1 ABC-type amino acid transport substrate-binding protein [Aestuariispira insulae]
MQVGRNFYKKIMALSLGMLALDFPYGRADTFLVGVENIEYMPHFSVVGEEYAGFARELLDTYARDRGHHFRYKPLPIKRLNIELMEGRIDFKYPDNPAWRGRDVSKLHFSAPVFEYVEGANVPPELYGSALGSLAIIRGFTPVPYLDRIDRGDLELSEHNSLRAALRFVLLGRTDAIYGERHVVQYYLRHMMGRPGKLVFDDTRPLVRDYYHLSSAIRPEALEDFSRWLEENRQKIAVLKNSFGLN